MNAQAQLFTELRLPLSPQEALVETDCYFESGGPHASAPCTLAGPAGAHIAAFVTAALLDRCENELTRLEVGR
jgi:hypothetical protein